MGGSSARFPSSMTQRYLTFQEWKASYAVRNASRHQHIENVDGTIDVYFYDGPEIHICKMWRHIVPPGVLLVYSQAQNDADLADWVANYEPDSNLSLDPRDVEGIPYNVAVINVAVPITGTVLVANQPSTQSIMLTSSSYGGRVEGFSSNGSSASGNPIIVSGISGSAHVALAVDSLGRLITAPAGSAVSQSGFRSGFVATAATTRVAVRETPYTEQSANAMRSIASSAAADAAAGTGARSVTITYYDVTGAGPFYETVTLAGTSYVNTVNSNICYIESIVIASAGSGGANVGVLTLRAAAAGGGVTIGTMTAGSNETRWCHHYVPVGKTCFVTGMSVSHNGTTVGSGALFTLSARAVNVATAVETIVSDYVRLYGQSSTASRLYGTPIKVVGPARLVMYVQPESSSAFTYRSAFDFYDQ